MSTAELEDVKRRVNICCSFPNSVATFTPPPPQSLGLFKGIARGSRYYYDFMQHFRHFPQGLAYHLEYGDVNYNMLIPTFCKSRPVLSKTHPYSYNVLLPLDRRRHFKHIFPPVNLPFSAKKDMLFFRGASLQPHRIAFLQRYFNHPLMDLGHVGTTLNDSKLEQILLPLSKPRASIARHLEYKFILSLEGYDVTSNLKWILSSNSIALMPAPKFESFFLESQLIPNVHYILIKDDYSDVQAQLKFFSTRPRDCLRIIAHANAYVQTFLKLEKLVAFLVIRKYFYVTGQLQVCP
ncbi:glycosyl transferase family 90 [Helicobacter suis]|uniref:glycosyl transferase family 90 n=1 Tax=Helicobacter suis TaxID=104628 RepID=UPI0013CFBDC5|nr:glycosyl transferase family 90 [Helicobacter suis]